MDTTKNQIELKELTRELQDANLGFVPAFDHLEVYKYELYQGSDRITSRWYIEYSDPITDILWEREGVIHHVSADRDDLVFILGAVFGRTFRGAHPMDIWDSILTQALTGVITLSNNNTFFSVTKCLGNPNKIMSCSGAINGGPVHEATVSIIHYYVVRDRYNKEREKLERSKNGDKENN